MVAQFLKDIRSLSALPRDKRYAKLSLYEYPFDHQLLTMSPLYRESRKQYLELGGRFHPRISSTMRSLSAQDLFADDVDYTPAASEIEWFAQATDDVYSPEDEIKALDHFSTISVFHEQNHRILWRLLPPAPRDQNEFTRYLNFAESLVVTLDLALADEIGSRYAPAFERMKVLYRTGRAPRDAKRDYLLSVTCATYFILELMNPEDVLKAVNYVRPEARKTNRAAVKDALDINELFVRITNPQWQEREWKSARSKLAKFHRGSDAPALHLPDDPLDLDAEILSLASYVLSQFEL